MIAAKERVPAPECLGYWGTEALERIGEIIPLGKGYKGNHRPSDFQNLEAGEKGEVAGLVRPAVMLAVEHYRLQKGVEPDEATITITNSVRSRKTIAPEKWHREEIFPDENIYIMASHNPTQFAHGHGIPLINALPGSIPINGIVNRLLTTGYLEQVDVPEHVLTVFDDRHIHRRPRIEQDGRISLSIGVYSKQLALRGIHKNRVRYMKFWREIIRQNKNDPYVL